MVQRLEEVLSINDFEKIEEKNKFFKEAKLIDVVEHLSIVYDENHIEVVAKYTLDNDYLCFVEKTNIECKKLIRIGNGERKVILLDELKKRDAEILENKWYLGEIYGPWINLLYASGHWLLTRSNDFYREIHEKQCKKGVFFGFIANEKAVLLEGIDRNGKPDHCCITTRSYLLSEENLLQCPYIEQNGYKNKSKTFEMIKRKIRKIENINFIILEGLNP